MRRRPLAMLLVLAALSLIAAGCGGDDDDDGGSSGDESSAPSDPETIAMTEYAFDPADFTIAAGSTQTLSNDGELPHNMAVVEGDDPLAGEEVASSEDIAPGESGALDLSDVDPGDYSVLCTIPGHAEDGMTGSITVE